MNKQTRRQFIKKTSAATMAMMTAGLSTPAQNKKRPNILFAISDDQSYPHAGAYGSTMVNTPAFDYVAKRGCLFTNSFAVAPQCSPNRAAILSGKPIWQLEEAGTHGSYFPKKWTVYPDLLEQAGYVVGYTAKGWGPGRWKEVGRDRNPAGEQYSSIKTQDTPFEGMSHVDYAGNFEKFLNDKPEDQPFYFWYGCYEPHRRYQHDSGIQKGKKLEDAEVPEFLPDNETVRKDLLAYGVEIEYFDTHLDRMLKLLDDRGELDNTLVVVTSDNGMPFPRAKANLYEYGIHMPMAVMWPDAMKGNRVVDDLVSFLDIAPTFLEAAGVEVPTEMIGRSMVSLLTSNKSGLIEPEREYVQSGRERHSHARYDNWGYPSRSLRTQDYLYIYNFKPDRWPAGDPPVYYDIDGGPTKSYMMDHRNDEEIKPLFEAAFGKRPQVEMFNIKKDPECLNNVAGNDRFRHIEEKMHNQLMALLKEQQDPRVLGTGDIFESYPRFNSMRPELGGFAKHGEYNPAYQK